MVHALVPPLDGSAGSFELRVKFGASFYNSTQRASLITLTEEINKKSQVN